jgi:hypothetical protein
MVRDKSDFVLQVLNSNSVTAAAMVLEDGRRHGDLDPGEFNALLDAFRQTVRRLRAEDQAVLKCPKDAFP